MKPFDPDMWNELNETDPETIPVNTALEVRMRKVLVLDGVAVEFFGTADGYTNNQREIFLDIEGKKTNRPATELDDITLSVRLASEDENEDGLVFILISDEDQSEIRYDVTTIGIVNEECRGVGIGSFIPSKLSDIEDFARDGGVWATQNREVMKEALRKLVKLGRLPLDRATELAEQVDLNSCAWADVAAAPLN